MATKSTKDLLGWKLKLIIKFIAFVLFVAFVIQSLGVLCASIPLAIRNCH